MIWSLAPWERGRTGLGPRRRLTKAANQLKEGDADLLSKVALREAIKQFCLSES
jgi:hypothetical protein